VRLEREGILTKVQHRVGSPHRGGIPFRRGSLFYLLKNPVYRGKIVHRGTVHDGEHVPIVDEELWDAVQAQLREKAPPRKRPKNDRQNALLIGLLADPHGRQIVPTYATKGARRYSYYETRKDLARPADPPSSRFGQGALDGHALRRLANLEVEEADLSRASSAYRVVRSRRLELPRAFAHNDLNVARLPVPPRPHILAKGAGPCKRPRVPQPRIFAARVR
jgi:site-specific DNA recombinase